MFKIKRVKDGEIQWGEPSWARDFETREAAVGAIKEDGGRLCGDLKGHELWRVRVECDGYRENTFVVVGGWGGVRKYEE